MNWWKIAQTQEEQRWNKRSLKPFEKQLIQDIRGDMDLGWDEKDSEYVPVALSTIYHMEDGSDEAKQWVWYWDGYNVIAKEGGTHGWHFPGMNMSRWYRGRYNPQLKMVTLTIPNIRNKNVEKVIDEKQWRKIDENADEIINGLRKQFGTINRIIALKY